MPARHKTTPVTDFKAAHSVSLPAVQTVPFVFCSPHSGRYYPAHFIDQARLDPIQLRKSEDAFVDELYAGVTELGAPLISATFPRAYLDVNREPYELDPELFAEPLPDYVNTHSVRVAGGLGTIARIVADGEEIYEHRLSFDDGLNRIETLYKPFHAELERLLNVTRETFGFAILIDCHSMPSNLMTQTPGLRPDFVVGDRYGASCDGKLTNLIHQSLTNLGYDVALNRPYAGGYITEHYGRPNEAIHALQLELNRQLYLHESQIEKSDGFDAIRKDLATAIEHWIEIGPGLLTASAQAAE